MSETVWKLHTESNNIIAARYATGSLPSITRGETTTFNLWFTESGDDLVVDSDQTIPGGTDEVYDTVTINDGNTLTVNGTLYTGELTINGTLDDTNGTVVVNSGTKGAWDTIRTYEDYAGKFVSLETLDSTQKYAEQFPSTADIESLVIGFEPNSSLQDKDLVGVWGIITNTEDARTPSTSTNQFTIEVRVLAEFDDYADHQSLEDDLLV